MHINFFDCVMLVTVCYGKMKLNKCVLWWSSG